MSIVSLLNISVLNNPAKFTDPYEFEITFECLEPLKDGKCKFCMVVLDAFLTLDLEWKLIYVGSSTSFEHDQELDSLLVGPVPVGVNKFVFTADPPSPEKIPASELVSVTVILLSCSYSGKEFVRVGYYVNNEYDTEELRITPPSKVQVDRVVRNILAEKPRVTRFNIVWDNEGHADEFPPEQPDVDLIDDEEEYGAGEGDEEDEEDEEKEGVEDELEDEDEHAVEDVVEEPVEEDIEEDLEEEEAEAENEEEPTTENPPTEPKSEKELETNDLD
jgi:histone chaperone ASF1